MRIAIFSSWLPEMSNEHKILAQKIGEYLFEKGITVVTGGCTGIPSVVIEKAHELGGNTVGYFPNSGDFDHCIIDGNHKLEFYTEKCFVKGFTARSLEMIKNVDAAIVLNGRIGTLSEFGIAVEEGLPLGVIEGTGGVTDELQRLTKLVKKEFPNNDIIFDKDYKKVIDFLINHIKNKKQD